MDAQGKNIVRFGLSRHSLLCPKLNVVGPWREWDSMGSEDAVGYAKKHNVPVPVSSKSFNSRNGNIWCLSREGDTPGEENEPNDTFMLTINPEDASYEAESVDIGIVSGVPVSVNGKKLSPTSLLTKLNEIDRRNGIGCMESAYKIKRPTDYLQNVFPIHSYTVLVTMIKPLFNFRVIVPVVLLKMFSMKESTDSRSGSNHLPALTRSAYFRTNESLTCSVS